MVVSYKKLWKLMIDRDLKKKDLKTLAGISNSSISKLGRNENVNTEVLIKVCAAMHCDFGDIMEIIDDTKSLNEGNDKEIVMINEKFGFDRSIVNALQDIDSIPTTEPNALPGVPGRLFIVAPEQKEELEHIVEVLDGIPQDEFLRMNETEKAFYSSLLNNAERVLKNSISRPAKARRPSALER